MQSNEQRSEEWYSERLGMFTGSQFSKLMVNSKKKDEILGEGAKTYIKGRIAEVMTNGLIREYLEFDTKEVRWGREYEPEAIKFYADFTGNKVEKCGFFKAGEHNTGASPDGLVNHDGLIEVKCPYNTSYHIEHLLLNSADDLKDYNKDYYYQIMCEMWSANRQWCDFVSYDPRATERTCFKLLRIERNETVISEMKERAKVAEIYMNEIITKIINR